MDVEKIEEIRRIAERCSRLISDSDAPTPPVPANMTRALKIAEVISAPFESFGREFAELDPAAPLSLIPDDWSENLLEHYLQPMHRILVGGPGVDASDLPRLFDQMLNHLEGAVREIGGVASRRIDEMPYAALLRRADAWLDEVNYATTIRALQRTSAEAEKARIKLDEQVEEIRNSRGERGAQSMAIHFSALARSERTMAEVFRALALVGFVLAAVFAYRSLDGRHDLEFVISHLTFVLAAVGVSTYLAAESAKHRSNAVWAASVKVQLQTVTDYCSPLAEPTHDQVMLLMAHRAFGQPPTATPRGTAENNPETTALLEQIVALLRASPTGR
jgi:hypothetical protein